MVRQALRDSRPFEECGSHRLSKPTTGTGIDIDMAIDLDVLSKTMGDLEAFSASFFGPILWSL